MLTVSEAGLLGVPDEQHLQRARDKGRVVVTQNDDFLRLHAAGKEHAGIAYAPHEATIGEMIRGLMLLYHVLEAEEMRGHVEYL